MEAFKRALSEIADSLIRPAKDWVLRQSWPIRLLFLTLLGLIAFAAWWPSEFSAKLGAAKLAIRALAPGDATIPISAQARKDLERGIVRLAQTVEADLAGIGAPEITPWSASQAVAPLALRGTSIPKDEYSSFVRSNRAGECFCWRERPEKPSDDVAIFISGWAGTAFAEAGLTLTTDELEYLLGNQNRNGWWPMFPETGRARFSSSYATAWMVLGLVRQRDKDLIPANYRPRVDQAIRRGVAWLMAARQPGARWKLHPNAPNSPQSESVSGFVLYVLHAAGAKEIEDVDQDWLDNLPVKDLEPHSVENQYFELRADDGISIDHFGQVRLPWILAATAKAYPSGSLTQRARALTWLDGVLRQPSVRNADTQSFNWVRAEVLFGLTLTLKEIGGSRGL